MRSVSRSAPAEVGVHLTLFLARSVLKYSLNECRYTDGGITTSEPR
jgi:hypothetical protein